MTRVFPFPNYFASVYREEHRAIDVGAVVVVCLLLFGALYANETTGAFRVWVASPTFNHCFLVLPLCLFMIWHRRNSLRQTEIRPEIHGVWAMFPIIISWLFGTFVGILELKQFVILSMVQVTLFSVFGSALYKKLAAALLYLYFLIPSGDYLIPSLQVLTAWFTVKGLHILGVPVYENGLVIAIPAGNFAVAEACAGLRFLIASVAFGVFFAIVTYRSLFRRLVFIACSIAMPLIANGLRVLGLILLAQWLGNPAEALADHVLYGWIFFSLVLIALVVFGQLLSDRHTTNAAIYPEANRSKLLPMPWPQMAVVGVSCFLVASVGSIAGSFLNLSHALNVPDAAPRVALPWRTIDAPTAWHPIVVGATRSFLRTFAQGPQRIDFFVALYGKQGGKTNLVRSINRDADEKIWRFSSEGSQAFLLQGRIVPVRETTWSDGTDKRIVWSFFVVDGRPTSSIWAAKFEELYGFLTNNSCASAYIAISMILHNAQDDKVMAEQIVTASEPLSTYLCKSTKTK